MGNSGSRHPSRGAGKVIFWDGTVQDIGDNHITAAELMLDHPQQVVVELQSAVVGKRPRPLPADAKLEENKVYMMIPVRRGKPASLSTEEARQVLVIASSVLRARNSSSGLLYTGFLPVLARVCTIGVAENERSYLVSVDPRRKGSRSTREEERVETAVSRARLREQAELESFDDASGGRPEYLSRQLSGKGWKPSLDTIAEKKIENKVSYWLF